MGNYTSVIMDQSSKAFVEIPLVVLNLIVLHKAVEATVGWVCVLSTDIFVYSGILVLSMSGSKSFPIL